jgi:hypothetical protein
MATGGSFPWEGSVKLTTHLHLLPRSRKVELYLHSPIRLHGIVLKLIKHRDNLKNLIQQNIMVLTTGMVT